MTSRKCSLLYLDNAPLVMICLALQHKGIELVCFREEELNPRGVYEAPDKFCQFITNLTVNGWVNAVIVGNNLGAGVKKAAAIDDQKRDRTIITWNDYMIGDEAPYAVMGFQHFCSRRDDGKFLLKILG